MRKKEYDSYERMIEELTFQYDDKKKKDFLIDYIYGNDMTYDSFMLYQATLASVGRFEYVANMPIAKMSPDLIKEYFYSFNTSSISTLSSYLSCIKAYLLYTDDSDGSYSLGYTFIMNLDQQGLKEFIDKTALKDKYLTPMDIERYIYGDKPFNASTMCIIVMIYMGISEEEIIDLKKSDISFIENKTIIKTKLRIYNAEYPELFKKAMNEEVYYAYDENGVIVRTIEFNNASAYFINEGIYEKKGNRGKGESRDGLGKISLVNLRRRINEIRISLGNKQITMQNLKISKKIYDMLEYFNFEKQGFTAYHKYLTEHSIKLSRVAMVEAADIMLEKIKKEPK